MKYLLLFLSVALLASGTGDATKVGGTTSHKSTAPTAPNGDWSRVRMPTSAGGFAMGNPNAKVKLIEYGSMTCPHCGAFDREGVTPLIDNYVKSGKVFWEFRNFIRDPFDLTAALVARCGGAASFFGVTRGLYATQEQWTGKLRAAPQSQLEALSTLPQQQQLAAVAKLAGLQQFAAEHGVSVARTNACLASRSEVNKLMQVTNNAVSQFKVPGTPGFVLNGKLVEQAASWDALEPKLKAALKG